jgi:hypothetical protein
MPVFLCYLFPRFYKSIQRIFDGPIICFLPLKAKSKEEFLDPWKQSWEIGRTTPEEEKPTHLFNKIEEPIGWQFDQQSNQRHENGNLRNQCEKLLEVLDLFLIFQIQ